MRLSDLQDKDVVDIGSGDKIGSVIDAEIKKDTGLITKLIVYEKEVLDAFKMKDEVEVPWEKIKKIGSDVILVERK